MNRNSAKFFLVFLSFTLFLVLLFYLPTPDPIPPVSHTPSLPPVVQVAVKENTSCFFQGYEQFESITIIQYAIVNVIAKNNTENWILIRAESFLSDCWMEVKFLGLIDNYLNILPTLDYSPSQMTSITQSLTLGPQFSTMTPEVVFDPTSSPVQFKIIWTIIRYNCNDLGKVTGALIDLQVSGGIPTYSFTPKLPVYAQPKQEVSIDIKSNSVDGEPSAFIQFTVPSEEEGSIFKCDQAGNIPGSPPPNIDEPVAGITENPDTLAQEPGSGQTEEPRPDPTGEPSEPEPTDEPPEPGPTDEPPEPEPTDEPVCYNPQGHEIPCKGKRSP